jgi:hypothetical protein
LTVSAPAAAADAPAKAADAPQAVTGTILSVSYATGDILIYQDSGSVLALYGLDRARLRDIGAGDRVAVTFGENLEVAAIERLDL